MENEKELEQNEKLNSIEVSMNNKGAYAWKIKKYYDDNVMRAGEIIEEIEAIDKKLKLKFINKEDIENE